MNFILLQVASLIYIILLNIFYFSKNHISNIENRIYKYLLIANVFGLLIELGCYFTVMHMDILPVLNVIVTRSLLIYYVLFISIYTYYVFAISYKGEMDDNKSYQKYLSKVKVYCSIGFIVCSIILCFLPMEYYSDASYVYSYGPAVTALQGMLVTFMTIWIIVLVRKYKNIKAHNYVPIIIFIVLAGIGGMIQKIYPQALLTTPIETLILMLMYFTIENPDMKLLEELHKSKEISDNANEEKTLFLYNMTQEIRNITGRIDDDANEILNSEDINENKDSARDIIATTSRFTSMTNEMFDVSKIDSANLKVYNNKYNIKNVIKQVVNVYGDICKRKELSFRTNVDHNIPDVLYGDAIELKEVLTIILDNSTKYTNHGFIELSVNAIIKNNICRLLITIEDSGMGIKSEEISEMKVSNKSLSKANKLITLMNGTMLISSNYGMGTKVKIILDQKIEFDDTTEIAKYDYELDNVNILVVDDNDSGIKIIEKLLKSTNIKMDTAMNGRDCVNKIKSHKYNLILLDEQLSEIRGNELLQKIKEIRNFKIPVILLTKDNNYEYNEEYLKQGFDDYLLKPVKKDEIIKKINKYTKEDSE